jgi:predicted nucleic acid-binding protein
MIVYALDTNTISFVLKGVDGISDRLTELVNEGIGIVIPPICYYEIKRWLIFANATAKARTFDALCENLEVGGLDKAVFDIAAKEHSRLKAKGINLDDADILIAAYCMYNDYILITDNDKHFSYFDKLATENWIARSDAQRDV